MHFNFEGSASKRKRNTLSDVTPQNIQLVFNSGIDDPLDFSPKSLKLLLSECEFALIDLSHERPSCYYEMGFIDALGVRSALIAETGTKIHQYDPNKPIQYYDGIDGYRQLVEKILSDQIGALRQ